MIELINESVQTGNDIESREDEFKQISDTITLLKNRINAIQELASADNSPNDRLDQIQRVITEREQSGFQYDDSIVRQMIECIKVYPDGKLEIIFGGGYIVEESITAEQKREASQKTYGGILKRFWFIIRNQSETLAGAIV